jgi:hypothetical protein
MMAAQWLERSGRTVLKAETGQNNEVEQYESAEVWIATHLEGVRADNAVQGVR